MHDKELANFIPHYGDRVALRSYIKKRYMTKKNLKKIKSDTGVFIETKVKGNEKTKEIKCQKSDVRK